MTKQDIFRNLVNASIDQMIKYLIEDLSLIHI